MDKKVNDNSQHTKRAPGRFILILLTVFVLYILAGVFLPPLIHKEAQNANDLHSKTENTERVLCIDDNQEALIWRLRVIESAKEELILTSFDFRDDNSGGDIIAALLAAAERGVHIRIVLDGINGMLHLTNSANFHALASHPNVEAKFYNPVNLLTPWTINYRMHDKYLIADGKIYLLGGRNTNDLFLGAYGEHANIDRDILVYTKAGGGSADALIDYFSQVWSMDCCQKIFFLTAGNVKNVQAELLKRYEGLKETYPEAFEAMDWYSQTIPAESILLLTNGIEPSNKSPELWAALVETMSQGQEIIIETPYIVCSKEMYQDITDLCKDGRQLCIITNAVESGANPFGCTDYLNQKEKILQTKSEVYEALTGYSLHTKTVLIDDNISIVGSYNLDIRSTYLDTELMLLIDCEQLNADLRDNSALFHAAKLMDMSRHTMPSGTQTYGSQFEPVELPAKKRAVYWMLQWLLPLVRHLL